MTGTLTILQGGPTLSVQDMGRPGFRGQGLTIAGAMDTLALHEGAALLRQDAGLAVIEMAGSGGSFRADRDTRIALTGAIMTAQIDAAALVWNASHLLPAGATLTIGGARAGSYGYLHVGGGIDTPRVMGARATHLRAGVGAALDTGDTLPLGADRGGPVDMVLPVEDRLGGGTLRCVASMQTASFADDVLARFQDTAFRRDPRANRMGIRMDHDGDGFATEGALSIVSEVTVPGDIQLTGDGAPFVLMCECQTTGGYPRIGTVIPSDLPRAAQAPAGARIRFEFIGMDEALSVHRRDTDVIPTLYRRAEPRVRNPADMTDLAGYQLAGRAISALADPFEQES